MTQTSTQAQGVASAIAPLVSQVMARAASPTAALTLDTFIDELASKAPTPGGGGAAALVGAIGTALGTMVGSLTVGKPKYASVEADVYALMERATGLQSQLLALIDRDAEVFKPLAAAYGLPSTTDEEKAHKTEVMEGLLCDCAEVPLRIMEVCAEAIDLHEEFAAKGSALAISDVGCGVVCCKAALEAASLNVLINTKSMKNREAAEELNARTAALIDAYSAKAEEIFADVKARFN